MIFNGPNEPAFPGHALSPEEPGGAGMTMREWYASQAMMGILSNSELPNLFAQGLSPSKMAESCFECADAMLAEAKKTAAITKGVQP